jgi:hypothetical protein
MIGFTEIMATTAGVAAVVAALAAAANAIIGLRTAKHIETLHIELNSRLTELLISTRAEGKAEGRAEGKAEVKEI